MVLTEQQNNVEPAPVLSSVKDTPRSSRRSKRVSPDATSTSASKSKRSKKIVEVELVNGDVMDAEKVGEMGKGSNDAVKDPEKEEETTTPEGASDKGVDKPAVESETSETVTEPSSENPEAVVPLKKAMETNKPAEEEKKAETDKPSEENKPSEEDCCKQAEEDKPEETAEKASDDASNSDKKDKTDSDPEKSTFEETGKAAEETDKPAE